MGTISKVIIAGAICGLASCASTRKALPMADKFDLEGHRGCRGLMPENTIPAMFRAIDLNVTTLEMDAGISKDLQVVVSHDPFFSEKITTTPSGQYLSKQDAPKTLLYSMNYDSIRKYDVGMKPHPDFPRQQKMEAHKPLLKVLLDSTEAYAGRQGKTMMYNIEIKSVDGKDGIRHPEVSRFADLLLDVVRAKGIEKRTIIQSFDMRAIKVVHAKYPDQMTSLLIDVDNLKSIQTHMEELGFFPSVYSPHYSKVDADMVKYCHDHKMKLVPWTINTVEEMQKLKDMGVDGLISDYPDLYSQLK